MYQALNDYADSYAESRDKFLAAMQGKGEVKSFLHDSKGPNGEDLYMDFGVIGPADSCSSHQFALIRPYGFGLRPIHAWLI